MVGQNAKDGPECNVTKEKAIRLLSTMRHGQAEGQPGVVSKMSNVSEI